MQPRARALSKNKKRPNATTHSRRPLPPKEYRSFLAQQRDEVHEGARAFSLPRLSPFDDQKLKNNAESGCATDAAAIALRRVFQQIEQV